MKIISIIVAFAAIITLAFADFHYADLAEPNEHNAMVSKNPDVNDDDQISYLLQAF